MSEPSPPPTEPALPDIPPWVASGMRWVRDLLIAVAICAFVILFVYQPFRVEGMSMSPTLRDREMILVNKFVYRFTPPERGDIIVFRVPGQPGRALVKRVVAVGGDQVEIRRGVLVRNELPVSEPYLLPQNRDHESCLPRHIPQGTLFVLGDHRSVSADSRVFDVIPVAAVRGKAVFRYWPLTRMESVR